MCNLLSDWRSSRLPGAAPGRWKRRSGPWVLGLLGIAACGGNSPCPTGTDLVEVTGTEERVRYCRDPAGLAHGPFQVFEVADDPDQATPRSEGTFDLGNPDGVFLYRFPRSVLAARGSVPEGTPEDPVQYRQEYQEGLPHGTWEERDVLGVLVARQQYDRGRRCGTWLQVTEGDQSQVREFTPCEDLPDPGTGEEGDAPPARGSFWDGSRCPGGEPVAGEGGTWCEEAGVRSGPSLIRDGDYEIVGEFRDGLPEGRFVAFWKGRAIREWHLARGRLEGEARRWHRNGVLAERGQYRQDRQDGPWALWSPSGHLQERGTWAQGLRHGLFERFVPGEVVIETTTWANGRREGPARTFYDDGAPECEGRYQEDRRQGNWTCLHPDGRKALEGSYRQGSRDGIFRAWNPDGGPLFEGGYVQGTPEGEWRFWDDSRMEDPEDRGRLVTRGTFLAGDREGRWEQRWERDEVLSAWWTFQDDQRHGPSETFYHNGQRELVGEYQAGRQHGAWRRYYRTGALHIEAVFFQDLLDGPYVEYAPDGTVIRKGRYVRGVFQPDNGM